MPAQRSETPSGKPWNVWSSVYGGQNNRTGSVATGGTHDTSVHAAGVATGLDYRLSPATIVGFALAGGSTTWGVSDGLGGGKSDVFQAGLYGSTKFGGAYLSASFAYAWHSMSTDRTVTLAGNDRLVADFHANSFGARVESGRRYDMALAGVTPYGALQVQAFRTPAYGEAAATGTNAFALAFDARTASNTRGELGVWFDRPIALQREGRLLLRGRMAWAHDWMTNEAINANFPALPGASFSVNGAATARDTMLTTAGAELRLARGFSLGGKFDGEFASRSRTYVGTGTLRYEW
jgi:outer membrane autotransporter protein